MGNRPPLPLNIEKLHRQTEEIPALAAGCKPVSLPPWNYAWNRHLTGRAPTGGCLYGGQSYNQWTRMDDFLHITDGPVGCGVYAQGARLHRETKKLSFLFSGLNLTTDFQERDIVFGGERKLARAAAEAEALFPGYRGMTLLATCPIALIGDNLESVAQAQGERLNKPIVAVNCAGFRRSDGIGDTHQSIVGTWRDWRQPRLSNHASANSAVNSKETTRDIVLLSHDLDEAADDIVRLLTQLGLNVVARWPGRSDEVARLGHAQLVVSVGMEYWAKRLQGQFGTAWMDADFRGITATAESLGAIAAHFDDSVQLRAQELIAAAQSLNADALAEAKQCLQGKLYFSMSALHPRELRMFEDFGIRVGSLLQGWLQRDGRWRAIAAPRRYHEITPVELREVLEEAQPDLIDGLGQDAIAYRKMGFSIMSEEDRRDLQRASGGFVSQARLISLFMRLFNSPVHRLRALPQGMHLR